MLAVHLPYHPPYHWESFLKFMALHLIKGIEAIENQIYYRTVKWMNFEGWLQVEHQPETHSLKIVFSSGLIPVQQEISMQLRNMFDLETDPESIFNSFSNDPLLKSLVNLYPGLRIPGTFNGFELAVRAILGQQISVRAATTLAGRIVNTFGDNIQTPIRALSHLSPSPDTIACLDIEKLTALGIIRTRAYCILRLAQEISSGKLDLGYQSLPHKTIEHLLTLPGIGPWTAHYIGLRALGEKNAFLKSDLALRQTLGHVSASQADKISQVWQPWRGYAVMYLWQKAIEEGFKRYQNSLSLQTID